MIHGFIKRAFVCGIYILGPMVLYFSQGAVDVRKFLIENKSTRSKGRDQIGKLEVEKEQDGIFVEVG